MKQEVFRAFVSELRKTADGAAAFRALDRAGQLAGSGMGRARSAPQIGNFGIRTVSGLKKANSSFHPPNTTLAASHDESTGQVELSPYEIMDSAAWKQTFKDLPIVIGGTALGFGVGKTIAEELGRRLAKDIQGGAAPPAWLKHAPMVLSTIPSVLSYALGRQREALRHRRAEASAKAKT